MVRPRLDLDRLLGDHGCAPHGSGDGDDLLLVALGVEDLVRSCRVVQRLRDVESHLGEGREAARRVSLDIRSIHS